MASISRINFDILLSSSGSANNSGSGLLQLDNGGAVLYLNQGGSEVGRVINGSDQASAPTYLNVDPNATPLALTGGKFAFASANGSTVGVSFFASTGLFTSGESADVGSSVSHFAAAAVNGDIAFTFTDADGVESGLIDSSGNFIHDVDDLELNNGSRSSTKDSAGHAWNVLGGAAIGNGALGVLTLTGSTISLHSVNLSSWQETGTPVTVATPANLIAGSVKLTSLAGGNVLLTWRDGGTINAKTIDASGHTIATFDPITPNQIGGYSIIPVTGGNFLAVYSDGSSDVSEIIGQLYDPNGHAISGHYLINDNVVAGHSNPSAVQLSSGDILVSWDQTNSSGTAIDGRLLSLSRPDATEQTAATLQHTPITLDPLTQDSSPTGSSLNIASVGAAAHGTVTFTGDSITYTPNAGFVGTDTFNYSITDTNGLRDTSRIDVHVLANLPAVLGDGNGDGHSDVIWRNTDGSFSSWNFTGTGSHDAAQQNTYFASVPNSWHVVDTFDMNGDGYSDVLWRNENGSMSVWTGSANGYHQGAYNDYAPTSWNIVGTGDVDGDGKSDILWQNSNGNLSLWSSTGAGFVKDTYSHSSPGGSWSVMGLGDFNGDGKADLLWHDATGGVSVWDAGGFGFQEGTFYQPGVATSWHIAGLGDFNGDGKDDILWQNTNGAVTVWEGQTSGSFVQGQFNASAPAGWHIAQVGDFNGDGKADIFWRSDSGATSIWHSNGQGFDQNTFYDTSVPTSWHVAGHDFLG